MVNARKSRVPKEEQLKLINDCRTSGMTDTDWCRARGWIFSCGNTANPAGREPPVRACGNRLCEFTRIMFCLSHIPHALIYHVRHQCLWYWCDNCHERYGQWLHLPEGYHHHQADHTIPQIYTGNRKSLKISCVSGGAVRRDPSVLNPLVS